MKNITTYRETPLTIEQFLTLEKHAAKFMTVREKMISKSVSRVDNNGQIYGWERDLVPAGVEVFFKAEPDNKVMESLTRLATDAGIAKALTDLEAHRTYGRGNSGWSTVLRDLITDLTGCSEWALIRICEKFRQERGANFFPQTADLVYAVKSLDESLRWAYAARPSVRKIDKPQEDRVQSPTDEGRARVAKALHDAGIPHDKEHCQQCKESELK